MIRTLAFCLLSLAACFPAAAACDCYNLFEVVPGHPDKTWHDLVKVIVPDLNDSGEGTEAIELPYVEELGDSDADPVPAGPIRISTVEGKTIQAQGRTLTVMRADLGQADGWATHVVALAVFDEDLKFLDAINIGQDQMTGIAGEPIRISAKDEALLTYSEHFNSNQTYGSYALVMVKEGKWQTIDVVSTLSDRWCAHERTQTLDVSAPDAGAGYWPITIRVLDAQTYDEAMDCGDQVREAEFTNAFETTYSWSASMGLYVAGEDGFEALGEVNQDRY